MKDVQMAKCEQRPCVEKEDNLMMGGTEGIVRTEHKQWRGRGSDSASHRALRPASTLVVSNLSSRPKTP